MKKILIVSATPFEVAPFVDFLSVYGQSKSDGVFDYKGLEIHIFISGVGLPLTAFTLGQHLAKHSYHLMIQAGVGGAIDRSLALGDVVEVVSDCFADLGVEEANGSFTTAMSMGLIAGDEYPFLKGRLWNQPQVKRRFLPTAHAVSVNTVQGTEASVAALQKNFPFAQVESMEGAAFFLAGLNLKVPMIQLRAISNYVEVRNRENWEMQAAITALNAVLVDMANNLNNDKNTNEH